MWAHIMEYVAMEPFPKGRLLVPIIVLLSKFYVDLTHLNSMSHKRR
jgi:hypothetical protein